MSLPRTDRVLNKLFYNYLLIKPMLIKLKIIPRSSQNKLIKLSNNEYKVKLTAAPVDGEANKKLLEFLSKEWKIPKSKIKITKGLASRRKIIEV